MDALIEAARDYYVVSFLFLYFTVGRLSLLFVMFLNLGPVSVCLSLIIGLEMVQIPVFFHFYSAIHRLASRIKNRIFKKEGKETGREGEAPEEKGGFFVRKFKQYGALGVFIIAVLPVKGCGVWSSILMGKTLQLSKKKLYVIVCTGALAGIFGVLLFGLVANQTAQALVQSMGADETVNSFQ